MLLQVCVCAYMCVCVCACVCVCVCVCVRVYLCDVAAADNAKRLLKEAVVMPSRYPQVLVWGLELGFRVWGLGFGVWGLGFGVWGLGFGVWGLGFEIPAAVHGAAEAMEGCSVVWAAGHW